MDDLLDNTGRWHWPLLFLNAYVNLPYAWFVMAPSFFAPNSVKFWCARPENLNITVDQWLLQNADFDVRCFANYSNGVEKCSEWEFDTNEIKRPMQMHFGTVCDREFLHSIQKSTLMAGLMVGNFVFSHLSDWFGRKLMFGICLCFEIGFNVLLLTAQDFHWVIIITFLASCGYGGLHNIPFTLTIESVGPSLRAVISTCQELGWIVGLVTFPLCTYFLTDWRLLQLSLLPPIFVSLFLWFFCDESPRWLVSKRKVHQAKRLLNRIVKLNKIQIQSAEIDRIIHKNDKEAESGRGSVINLFESWTMAKIAMSFYVQFAVTVLLYFSLIFYIVDFGTNPHLNLFISGLLELPLMPIAYYTLKKIHRKRLYLLMYIPALVSSIVLAFMPPGYPVTNMVLASIGKWASQLVFTLLVVHVAECFPTHIRAVAVGTSLTMSRIGAIVAPFMKHFGIRWGNVICAALVIVAYLWSTVLPETLHEDLPDNFEEVRLKLKKQKSSSIHLSESETFDSESC